VLHGVATAERLLKTLITPLEIALFLMFTALTGKQSLLLLVAWPVYLGSTMLWLAKRRKAPRGLRCTTG
jgi:hypothetical protein